MGHLALINKTSCRGFVLSVILLMLVGCSDDIGDSADSANKSPSQQSQLAQDVESAPLIYGGDLDTIRATGILRIAGVRNDVAALLNRSGLPAVTYQDFVGSFSNSVKLTPQWVYFDDLPSALASLDAGLSDIVMSNITVTDQRRKLYNIDFTRPLIYIDEIIIGRRGAVLADTSPFVVTAGSSYIGTLQATDHPIKLLSSQVIEEEILTLLSKDNPDASLFTLMDEDLVASLITGYPDLQTFGSMAKNRKIAWAIRADAVELKDALNQYLLSSDLLQLSSELRNWEQIKASGILRMATFNGPTTYYMRRGYHAGFEYDLLSLFAKQHGLKLQVLLIDSAEQLSHALTSGSVDIAAASLNETAQRNKVMRPTIPYLYTQPFIVAQKGLQDPVVALNPQNGYETLVESEGFRVEEVPQATVGSLAYRVFTGQLEATVVNGHFAKILKIVSPDYLLTPLGDTERGHVWYVARQNVALSQQLNLFIKNEYKGLNYNVIYNRYFKHVNRQQLPENFDATKPLSPYDALFKKYATTLNYDWRLLAAQAFQESRFNARATSHQGARGLMQVLPRTAKAYGVSNLYDPEQSLIAATRHLQWLYDRFPTIKDSSERVWFTLAAYNAGHGHVRDAQALARKMGLKDDVWDGNVAKAMLALSDPRNYKHSRYGYVRGTEPVNYVADIKQRYRIYTHNQ